MIRISCFKHEREILLYSQTLPIKATETFADDDETMINHLMHSLQSTTTPINDSKAFLKKIGIQFKSEWIPRILDHSLFERESKYKLKNGQKKMVKHRLVEELGISSLKIQEIPLTVYRHRGHYDYHPRNLLDQKGTRSAYRGTSPSLGDWITFKIESPSIFISKAVIIRNYPHDYGLKSISLSLSVDGDEFQDFAVIKDIHNDDEEEQYFNLKDVMVRNAKIWMNDCKFIKLKVLSNWGGDYNVFHSFSVLGAMLKFEE